MTRITKASKKCIDLIIEFESSNKFFPKPYLCPANVWTIGFGTTKYFDTGKSVKSTDGEITEHEGYRLMYGHLSEVFEPLAVKLTRADLNQNQFDAVVDFLYNCGATYTDKKGKIQLYNLFKHINERMPQKELTEYWHKLCITAKGVEQNGLKRRRKAEVALYFS